MKNLYIENKIFIPVLFLLILSITSCSPRMYRTTPVNAPLFANKGEVQVSGALSSSGGTVNGGVALTDHVALEGVFNGSLKGTQYQAHESEGALGYMSTAKGNSGFRSAIYIGAGGGNNFYLDSGAVIPEYSGRFSRYFITLSGGTTTGKSSAKIKGGGGYALRFTYMTYAGEKNADRFWGSNFYTEPYFYGNLGGKHLRFEFGAGFPLKLDFKWANDSRSNITMLPLNLNFGIRFIFGRNYAQQGGN